MGTPQTLDDSDLPIAIPGAVQTPDLLIIRVEGTAEQLPKRMARELRLYGFEVRFVEEASEDAGAESQAG